MNRREFMGTAGGALAAALLAARLEAGEAETRRRGGEMPMRPLGKTGEKVSLVAFGSIALRPLSRSEATAAVRSAIDRGVNHVDAAPSYYETEAKVRPALRGGYRKRVFLACKTMERTKEGARRELEQSLRTLGAEHFDLYQFHSVDTLDELNRILAPGGAMETFQEAKEKGLIRFIGISGHDAKVLLEALRRFAFASVMTQVSFVDRFCIGSEEGLLPYAQEKGVGVIAIKVSSRGEIKDLKSAYSYMLSQPVTNTIPAGTVEEINAAINLLPRLKTMPTGEMLALFRDSPYLGNRVCRQCGYCLPCPAGIDIPYLFALEGYGNRYRKAYAAATYRSLKVRGSACIECGECTRRCPFGLDAMNRIRRMDSVFGA